MRRKDRTGKRFGKLVALKISKKTTPGNIWWQCRCDCGNIKEIRSGALSGTKSCGCSKLKNNLSGMKIGRWKVLENRIIKYKVSYWECKCECGNVKYVSGSSLKSSKSTSCGCSNIDHFFFRTPNIINSYIAGFIAADGNLDKRGRVRISLAKKDRKFLKKIAKVLSAEHLFREVSKAAHLEMYSKNMNSDLINNFNINPRKTYNLKPPNGLKNDMTIAYLAGYIDGDGCITNYKNILGKTSIRISGTYEILSFFKDFLEEELETKLAKLYYEKRTKNNYMLFIGGRKTIMLYKKVIEVVPENLIMNRKWSKLNMYLEDER